MFPDASLKIFLTGRPEVRAQRRFEEIKRESPEEAIGLTMDKVLESLNKRDDYDSKREISPLIQPKDAYLVDTSDLNPDEIVFKILEIKDSLRAKR